MEVWTVLSCFIFFNIKVLKSTFFFLKMISSSLSVSNADVWLFPRNEGFARCILFFKKWFSRVSLVPVSRVLLGANL